MTAQMDWIETPGFYNTTNMAGAELDEAKTVTAYQNAQVMAIFRRLGRSLTPWEVWQDGVANGSQWLIGSVRRSVTVLTDCGALVKLETMKPGPHGRRSFEWALAAGQETQKVVDTDPIG